VQGKYWKADKRKKGKENGERAAGGQTPLTKAKGTPSEKNGELMT